MFPGPRDLEAHRGQAGGRRTRGSRRRASEDAPEAVGREAEAVRGIGLEVKFANKSPRSLSLLSGGEKAMTAIAFLFSLFLARPCPFYILDEVEASLDDINIRRFLSLVRQVPGQDAVHHHHPPAADHGGRRHALRRHARERRHLAYPFPEAGDKKARMTRAADYTEPVAKEA